MGRQPIGDRAMTGVERNRRWMARLRQGSSSVPPPPGSSPGLATASAELLERIRIHPRQAALWLRERLGHTAAEDLGHALAPAAPTEPSAKYATYATLAAGRTMLNLEHVRRAPGRTVPWVVDKLARDDAQPATRAGLERALADLAAALQRLYGEEP